MATVNAKVLPCACTSEDQDQRFGPGRRLHNRTKPDSKGLPSWRCTVCLAQREAAA